MYNLCVVLAHACTCINKCLKRFKRIQKKTPKMYKLRQNIHCLSFVHNSFAYFTDQRFVKVFSLLLNISQNK